MQYHTIKDAKKYYHPSPSPPAFSIQDIEEDPDYADLYQLSNVDDDFQCYLPRCLLRYGNPACCREYHDNVSYLDD